MQPVEAYRKITEYLSGPGGAYVMVESTKALENAANDARVYPGMFMPSKIPLVTLSEKIFRISKAVGKIEKNGVAENKDLEGKPLYLYAKAEDIFDRMVPLLEKHKLLLTGSVLRDPLSHVVRGGSSTTEVTVEWTLEDVVTKESRTWRIPGTGTEELGLYKALTGSRKQFYILVFNLRIGDDPESLPEKKESKDAEKREKRQPANDQSSVS